jgi:hypothetical protein
MISIVNRRCYFLSEVSHSDLCRVSLPITVSALHLTRTAFFLQPPLHLILTSIESAIRLLCFFVLVFLVFSTLSILREHVCFLRKIITMTGQRFGIVSFLVQQRFLCLLVLGNGKSVSFLGIHFLSEFAFAF